MNQIILQDISTFTEDSKLLSLVLPPERLENSMLEVKELARATDDKELRILSLAFVREIVLGTIIVLVTVMVLVYIGVTIA